MNTLIRSFMPLLLILATAVTATIQASNEPNEPNISLDEKLIAVNSSFEKANKLALKNPTKAQALYQASVIEYQYLSEQPKMQSAELYTNLGNACYFAGDHGRAVLNYHRALRIDPLLDDPRHNLHHLRTLTVDEIPKTRTQTILHTLTFWHRWPWSIRAAVLAIAVINLWGVLGVMLYRSHRWLKISAASMAALSLLAFTSLLVSHQGWDNPVDSVVIDREVLARQGNGVIYGSAFKSPLHAGTEFSVIEHRGGWYHAQLLDGARCWIPSKSAALVVQP